MLCVTQTGLSFGLVKFGVGKHTELVDDHKLRHILNLSYPIRLVYNTTLTSNKLALCFTYRRIFADSNSGRICYAIMTFMILYTIAALLPNIFECTPVEDAWSISFATANCPADDFATIVAFGMFNIATDVALIVFVLPKICQLTYIFEHALQANLHSEIEYGKETKDDLTWCHFDIIVGDYSCFNT